jgi:hypothetical protein
VSLPVSELDTLKTDAQSARNSMETSVADATISVVNAIEDLHEAERRSRNRGFLEKVRSKLQISRSPKEASHS